MSQPHDSDHSARARRRSRVASRELTSKIAAEALLALHRPAPRVIHRRIAALWECLGLDSQTVRDWGVAKAVLSARWSLEEGRNWRPAMKRGAAMMATLEGAQTSRTMG
jgi:streptomycin 6-kinase